MIQVLHNAGLTIKDYNDDQILLSPADKITNQVKAFVEANKKEIIQELKAKAKPTWCIFCDHHKYRFIDNIKTLFCEESNKPVYLLDKCLLNYWMKDKNGRPQTIN